MRKFAHVLAIGGAAAVALVVATVPGFAGTNTGTLTVQGTVAANCTISDATLDFGSSIDLDTDTTANTTFTVGCTTGSGYSVAMNSGLNGSGTGAAIVRKMKDSGTDVLTYQLYTNSGESDVWVDVCSQPVGGPGTDCAYGTGSGTSTPDTITVYGKIASGQNVPAAAYTDSVTMTVTF